MGKKKYLTEEERKAAHREADRRYYQNNKEKLLAKSAERYQNNKEKLLAKSAERYQNNKEKLLAKSAEHYQNNKEKIAAKSAERYQNNKEKLAEYRSTPFGRADNLIKSYRHADKKHNRGECTITPDWIVENIFNGQVCHYCGKADWRELGCDRIDNSLPHVPGNVVPCCCECNKKRGTTPYDEFMKLIGKIA